MHDTHAPLCIGHSHVACIVAALKTGTQHAITLNFWELGNPVIQDERGVRLRADVEQQVHAHRGPVFSMMGGSAHTLLGLLVHPRPFDFVLPSNPELPLTAGAELVPATAMRATMQEHLAYYIALMHAVAQAAQRPIRHIDAPPPHRDSARIAADVPWALYPGMRHEVAPSPFRFKLWQLQSQCMRDACAAADIGFLAHPDGAADENGFLKEIYYQDGVHANAAYGALLVHQMAVPT